jgi:hypothetical protein
MELSKHIIFKISDRFAVSEKLSDGEDINRPCENIKESIKHSATDSVGQYQVKQHKPKLYKQDLSVKSKESG